MIILFSWVLFCIADMVAFTVAMLKGTPRHWSYYVPGGGFLALYIWKRELI